MKKMLAYFWFITAIVPFCVANGDEDIVYFCDIGSDGHHYKDLTNEFIALCDTYLSKLDEFPDCLRYPVDQCVAMHVKLPNHDDLAKSVKRSMYQKYRQEFREEKKRLEVIVAQHIKEFEPIAQAFDEHLKSAGVYLFVDKKDKQLRFFFTDEFENLKHRFAYCLPQGARVCLQETIEFTHDSFVPFQKRSRVSKPSSDSFRNDSLESEEGGAARKTSLLPALFSDHEHLSESVDADDSDDEDTDKYGNSPTRSQSQQFQPARPLSPLRIEYNPNAFLGGRNITGRKRVFDEIARSPRGDGE